MKTVSTDSNPKFEFYSELLRLLQSAVFDSSLAGRVAEIYEANVTEISLHGVSAGSLETWHQEVKHPKPGEDYGIELMELIARLAFKDLAPQMRGGLIRDFHRRLKSAAGIPDDLFVHVRRIKELGEDVSAITIVTDDLPGFRKFWENPEKYVRMTGYVHYSESGEVTEE